MRVRKLDTGKARWRDVVKSEVLRKSKVPSVPELLQWATLTHAYQQVEPYTGKPHKVLGGHLSVGYGPLEVVDGHLCERQHAEHQRQQPNHPPAAWRRCASEARLIGTPCRNHRNNSNDSSIYIVTVVQLYSDTPPLLHSALEA